MNGQDWERFGEEIRRTVQDAVEHQNYDRLNATISKTVNQVAEGVAKGAKNIANYASQKSYNGEQGHQKTSGKEEVKKKPPKSMEIKNPSKVGWTILSILGYGGSALFIILGIVFLMAATITSNFSAGFQVLFGVDLVALAISAVMAGAGTRRIKCIDRFRTYVKEIGSAEFCNIADLAEKVRKSEKFVVSDLEKMIRKGWILQGHFDKQKACLIVTDEMYDQYKQLEKRRELQLKEEQEKEALQREEARRNQESLEAQRKGLSPEVQKVIEQGDSYIHKIFECNEAIPGEEISAKISYMQTIVEKIFKRVEQNPETVSDIRKLMEYYLPTTVKLLEAYAEMDAQPVGGENIESAKREIEATLDTLNVAFEKLLDTLFQDTAWDVSSDISVLNTMLAQEGLKEDGLKR